MARKVTLPRHTNLAPQGRRTGAFFIDLAIFCAILIFNLFLVTNPIMSFKLNPMLDEFKNAQLESGLRILNENGEVDQIKTDASSDEYINTLSYYYLEYRNEETYNVEWFNKTILEINTESSLFTYKVNDDNEPVLTEVGVAKEENKDTNVYLQKRYLDAYSNFCEQDNIADLQNNITFIYSVELSISGVIATVITYIIIPLLIKNGQTVGKKVFKLSLANKDGYALHNSQLLMRAMPLLVVLLSMLVPVWKDLILVLIVYLIIFLVSFALSMASPKKMSLHDYTGGTIVVDHNTSLIFNSASEEEEYTLKEDGLFDEENSGNEN